MRSVALLLIASSLLCVSHQARSAESYPTRPVTVIVPFTAGGNTDISGRIIAEAFTKRLGQSFVVENRGGAAGLLGASAVAKARPDGYTLLIGASGPTTISPMLHPSPGFDPQKALTPISLISTAAIAIVANPSVPAKNVTDLIELARSKPNVLRVGTAGTGTSGHLANELFQYMAKIKFAVIPFNGGGPAATAVIGGHVDLLFDQVTSTMPHVQEGKLRALAVTTPQRAAAYPDIPTVAESGLKGYQAETYTGLFAPADTPKAVVDKLYTATVEALADPDVVKKFANVGAEAKSLSPEKFREYLAAENGRWAAVVKAAGLADK
jgi:tripartite-type tricarboxylate transporter receptor subunit TctC